MIGRLLWKYLQAVTMLKLLRINSKLFGLNDY